jgi:hypothetical protein
LKEKDMYRQLKYKLDDHILLQRIESHLTGLGIPDVYFKTMYNEGWIEFKEVKPPPSFYKKIIKIPFRPGQFGWIKHYVSLNGNMILACTVDKTWYCFKGHLIKQEYHENDFYSARFQGDISELNLQKLLQKE